MIRIASSVAAETSDIRSLPMNSRVSMPVAESSSSSRLGLALGKNAAVTVSKVAAMIGA